MPKRSSNDINQTAFSVVQQSIGQTAPTKNPAAVALGRLGGLKGGVARASSLSSRRKAEIARKAAVARWKQRKK